MMLKIYRIDNNSDLVIVVGSKALERELKNELNFHILDCILHWFMQPFAA